MVSNLNVCVQCSTGYKLSPTSICELGIYGCIAYTSNGSCQTCDNNYVLSNGVCSNLNLLTCSTWDLSNAATN